MKLRAQAREKEGKAMAALETQNAELEVREGVDRETIETVNAMAGKYKYGWETEIETA